MGDHPSSGPIHRTMKPTTLFLAAILLAGCQNYGGYSRASLNDGLLQFAEASAKDEIKTARMSLIEAGDATAAARHDARHAGADRKVLQAELRAARERLGREKERSAALAKVVHVEEERAVEIDESVATAQHELSVCQQRVQLHDAKAEVLKVHLDLAKAEEAHAAAVVDLLKARALRDLGREETAAIDVLKFERAERDCETEIEIAKTVLRSAQREVSILEERMYWED